MKLNKFAYLYSKPLGNHTLKIMKKIPGNVLINLEKSWKYHGMLSVQKSGNPVSCPYYYTAFQIKFLYISVMLLKLTILFDYSRDIPAPVYKEQLHVHTLDPTSSMSLVLDGWSLAI